MEFFVKRKKRRLASCITTLLLVAPIGLMADCDTRAGVFLNKAILAFDQAKYDEALRSVDRAIEIDSDCSNAWNTRGNALNMLGRFQDAQTSLDAALKHNPENVGSIWSNKGAVYERSGELDKATDAFRQAISLGYDAWANLAFTYALKDDFKTALATAEESLKKNVSSPSEPFIKVGNVLRDRGLHADALKLFERAVEVDPKDANAWSSKGNALTDLKRFDEAIKAHDEAVKLAPGKLICWLNRGFVRYKQGRLEEALEDFEQAIARDAGTDPNALVMALNNKGYILKDLGRHAEAMTAFEAAEAVGSTKKSEGSSGTLALGLELQGDYKLTETMKMTTTIVGVPMIAKVTLKASDALNLRAKYLSISVETEKKLVPGSVLIDDHELLEIPYEIRLEDRLEKPDLVFGDKKTIDMRILFKVPGLYSVKIVLGKSVETANVLLIEPEQARQIRKDTSTFIAENIKLAIAFLTGIIAPLFLEGIRKRYKDKSSELSDPIIELAKLGVRCEAMVADLVMAKAELKAANKAASDAEKLVSNLEGQLQVYKSLDKTEKDK